MWLTGQGNDQRSYENEGSNPSITPKLNNESMSKVKTADLSDLIHKSGAEVREYKEKLLRALHNFNQLDCLTDNEERIFDVLSKDPMMKIRCKDILK